MVLSSLCSPWISDWQVFIPNLLNRLPLLPPHRRHACVASVGRSNRSRLLIRLFRPVRSLPISRNASGPCNSNGIPRLDHSATRPAIALAQAQFLPKSTHKNQLSVGSADVSCLPYPSITGSTLSLTGQSFMIMFVVLILYCT